MTTLKIFNVFYGLKLIEPLIKNKKITITEDHEQDKQYLFSNLKGKHAEEILQTIDNFL
jgi:hypothetical protein